MSDDHRGCEADIDKLQADLEASRASAKTSWGLYQGATPEVAALKAQLAAVEANLRKVNSDYVELRAAGEGPSTHAMSLAAKLAQATAERDALRVRIITEDTAFGLAAELGLEYREDDGPQPYWRNTRAQEAERELREMVAERDAAREAHEKAIQTQGKIMDGMRVDLATTRALAAATQLECNRLAADCTAARAEIAEALQAFGDWKVEQDSVGRGLRYRIGLTLADLSTARAEVERLTGELETEKAARKRSDRNARCYASETPDYDPLEPLNADETHLGRAEAKIAALSAELSSARAALEGMQTRLDARRARLVRISKECAEQIARAEKAEAALAEVAAERDRQTALLSRVAHANEDFDRMQSALADARLVLGALGLLVDQCILGPYLKPSGNMMRDPKVLAAFRRLENPKS